MPLATLAQGTITPTQSLGGQAVLDNLNQVSNKGYVVSGGPTAIEFVGIIINAFFGLLGIVFIVLILLAGYNWMTAQGDESKVEKAQDTLRYAIIGLVIIVGAFAIWQFINFAFIHV